MKLRKKIYFIILILILTFSNIGCNSNKNNVIPDNCIYNQQGKIYTSGKQYPSEVKNGDIFKDKFYTYHYNEIYNFEQKKWQKNTRINGWSLLTLNKNLNKYGKIRTTINKKPITFMGYTFANCKNIKESPKIPKFVNKMEYTFYNSGIRKIPDIPKSVNSLCFTFYKCKNIKNINQFNSNNLTELFGTFMDSGVENVYFLPNTLISMPYAFTNCKKINYICAIPQNVNNITYAFANSNISNFPDLSKIQGDLFVDYAFSDCPNLKGQIVFNCTKIYGEHCFDKKNILNGNIKVIYN